MKHDLGTVGFIGRMKPLHNGAAKLLTYLCERADHVIIGVGSSNKYNLRNPFTPEETTEMVHAFLRERYSNYTIIPIPDFGHLPDCEDGRPWRQYVLGAFGNLDHFVTSNHFVKKMLEHDYHILYPADIVPKKEQVMLSASHVRYAMAHRDTWENLVPREVVRYLKGNGLDERFRKEFGSETLAKGPPQDHDESAEQEHLHAREQ